MIQKIFSIQETYFAWQLHMMNRLHLYLQLFSRQLIISLTKKSYYLCRRRAFNVSLKKLTQLTVVDGSENANVCNECLASKAIMNKLKLSHDIKHNVYHAGETLALDLEVSTAGVKGFFLNMIVFLYFQNSC